jgi:hypothetical protein
VTGVLKISTDIPHVQDVTATVSVHDQSTATHRPASVLVSPFIPDARATVVFPDSTISRHVNDVIVIQLELFPLVEDQEIVVLTIMDNVCVR